VHGTACMLTMVTMCVIMVGKCHYLYNYVIFYYCSRASKLSLDYFLQEIKNYRVAQQVEVHVLRFGSRKYSSHEINNSNS